jgi:hypothetical protein
MSKPATRIYSTWFSVEERGYCDRSFREDWPNAGLGGPDMDECWEEAGVRLAMEDDLRFESEGGPESVIGGWGDLRGCEAWETSEAERDEAGKDESDAREA